MTSDDRISLVERAVKRMNEGEEPSKKTAAKTPAAKKATAKKTVAKKASAKTAAAKKTATRSTQAQRVKAQKPEAAAARADVKHAETLRLNMNMLRKKGLVTPQSGRSRLVEDMRAVKRPIIKEAFLGEENGEEFSNVVMISSCRSGEGKTFTAINLAMSIAMERDLYVLLVDLDIYRRGVCEVLDIPVKKGLVDMVLDPELDLAEVMHRTNVENLSILQAGTSHPHATELLASNRMTEIIQEISKRYPDRIILVDTPPILASSEPSVVAAFAGQVILVVEEGQTSRQLIENALEEIPDAENVSFILNKHRRKPKDGAYGANYNYDTKG